MFVFVLFGRLNNPGYTNSFTFVFFIASKAAASSCPQVDLWVREHGSVYAEGISPAFHAKKVRHYDSAWNWAKQDLIELVLRISADPAAGMDPARPGLSVGPRWGGDRRKRVPGFEEGHPWGGGVAMGQQGGWATTSRPSGRQFLGHLFSTPSMRRNFPL